MSHPASKTLKEEVERQIDMSLSGTKSWKRAEVVGLTTKGSVVATVHFYYSQTSVVEQQTTLKFGKFGGILLILFVLALLIKMRRGSGRGGKGQEANEIKTKRDNAAYVVAE